MRDEHRTLGPFCSVSVLSRLEHELNFLIGAIRTWWSCVFSTSSGSSVQSLQVDSKYVCIEGEMNKGQADGHTDFTCIYSFFPLLCMWW